MTSRREQGDGAKPGWITGVLGGQGGEGSWENMRPLRAAVFGLEVAALSPQRGGTVPFLPTASPPAAPTLWLGRGVGGLGTPRSPSLRFGVGGRGRVGLMWGGCVPRLDPKAPQSHPCTSLQLVAGLSLLLGTPQLVGGGQPDPHIYSAGAQGRPHPLGTTPPPHH